MPVRVRHEQHKHSRERIVYVVVSNLFVPTWGCIPLLLFGFFTFFLMFAFPAAVREQVQADPRRVRMKDRNRDALLDQLVERALDVSPYVR